MESSPFGVSALAEHFVVIIDGSVHTWGYNGYGQLGDGTTTVIDNKAYKIQDLDNVVSVAWGFYHSMAMTQDGDVYLWGCNEYGQLGDGTTNNSTKPKKLNLLNNIKMIACSSDHNSMFITKDGDVYSWGKNDIGQLGNGTTNHSTTPQKINNLTNIATISCGHEYSIAVTVKGDMYSWGLNNYGQLGNGSTISSSVPQRIYNFTNVTTIACGNRHALALMSCGDVYSWGYNGSGQLGNGNFNSTSTPQKIPNLANIVAISCGYQHSMALTKDGYVYSWGRNSDGQLGVDGIFKSSVPLKVNIAFNVCTIACVGYNSMVLTSDGHIFGWGYNGQGQLCNGTSTKSTIPQILDLPFGTVQWSIPFPQNIVITEQHIHMEKLSHSCAVTQNTTHDNYLHTIICNNERQFNIHKAIIRVRYPKLENIELSISPNLFEHIVYFIYTNKIPQYFFKSNIVPNELIQLIHLCKMIELKELVEICHYTLVKSFTIENIFEIAVECYSLNLADELDWIIWFIGKHKLTPPPAVINKLSTNIISKLFSEVINPTIPAPPPFKTNMLKTLNHDMKILFSDKTYSDFTINFKNTPIKVHKFILSPRWPFFTTNINSQHSSTTIHKSDMPLSTFQKLIEYFYFGIESLSLEDCNWILKFENFYQLQDEKTLLKYCHKNVDFGLKETFKLAIETDNEEMEKSTISLILNSVDPQQQISFLLSFAKEHQRTINNQKRTIEELKRTCEEQIIIQQKTNEEHKKKLEDVNGRLVKMELLLLWDH